MNADTSATRQRLLQAAIEEFAVLGFDHATVRDMCRKADVNLSAVKYYFNDKLGLYIEAVKTAHRANRMGRGLVDTDEIAAEFNGDPEQRLRAFIDGFVSQAMAAQDRSDFNHLLMFREIANPTVATEHIVREYIRPNFERLNLILKELLPPQTSPLDRRLLAMSIVGQCMHYKMAGPIVPMLISESEMRRLTPQRVAEHITQVTLAAIERHRESQPSVR